MKLKLTEEERKELKVEFAKKLNNILEHEFNNILGEHEKDMDTMTNKFITRVEAMNAFNELIN